MAAAAAAVGGAGNYSLVQQQGPDPGPPRHGGRVRQGAHNQVGNTPRATQRPHHVERVGPRRVQVPVPTQAVRVVVALLLVFLLPMGVKTLISLISSPSSTFLLAAGIRGVDACRLEIIATAFVVELANPPHSCENRCCRSCRHLSCRGSSTDFTILIIAFAVAATGVGVPLFATRASLHIRGLVGSGSEGGFSCFTFVALFLFFILFFLCGGDSFSIWRQPQALNGGRIHPLNRVRSGRYAHQRRQGGGRKLRTEGVGSVVAWS
mmetsp:Transcript_21688/g.44527  ORF Transcript_21688/g.44527 Transcript_21688/m.44527 type:complete len:265 (+) Transcript_21688:245-1039(+)